MRWVLVPKLISDLVNCFPFNAADVIRARVGSEHAWAKGSPGLPPTARDHLVRAVAVERDFRETAEFHNVLLPT